MAQRPRLSQLKRTDVNFRTFKEQYESLEGNTEHQRYPVRTKGDLPMTGNVDGSQCFVIEEGVLYFWSENLQNWQSVLGKAFEIPDQVFKRKKRKFVAEEGQTIFLMDFQYNPGVDELDVYIQGILQDVDTDYYETDDRTIEFTSPLKAGMQVTVATPMIVRETLSHEEITKRLVQAEQRYYQLMMNQYYSGKPVDAKGMVFDGFLNTDYIDYAATTLNVRYDNISKSMSLETSVIRKVVESFDGTTGVDPSSTILVSNSEMTLAVSTLYTEAFADDFSTSEYIDWELTNAYHDIEKELITTVATYSGGDHYYQGDFMTTTDKVDRVGFSQSITRQHAYYRYDANQKYYEELQDKELCYSILPMGNMTAVINEMAGVYRSEWPYSGDGFMYRGGDVNAYRSDGYTNSLHQSGSQYILQRYGMFANNNGQYFRSNLAYVSGWNRVVSLEQYTEAAGRYYQRLYYATGQQYNISWTAYSRPTDLPVELFGSASKTFTDSLLKIDQIGSTKNELLLRVGDKLFFLDSSLKLIKTLDWTDADRKPSNYNRVAAQMTADARYLYFPARLNRNGQWGYYLEVFDQEDGRFVNEILVTRDYSGDPATTAMGFDWKYNRLILGQQGNYWYNLYGKSYTNNYTQTSYAGFIHFQAPDLNERAVYSERITTNLPVVKHQLTVDETLNQGEILYYIRFNDEAWTRIYPDVTRSWVNANGAKESTIQLRAVLRSSLNASVSPELTEWKLNVCQFLDQGAFHSTEQLLSLSGAIGGQIISNQDIPQETSLNWSIQLDQSEEPITVGTDGAFDTNDIIDDAYVTTHAVLGTNNTLISPVVRDYKVHFHQVDAGVLVTEAVQQLEDIHKVSMWVTTGGASDYYDVELSRDGGVTWVEATKANATTLQNGNVETLWETVFEGAETSLRSFKIKFTLNSAVSIYQYGAMLN
jgi:hypothetical protein